MLTKEFINPHAMGFTNTVTYSAQGVKTIIVSGQVGYADGRVGETFEEQAEIAHQNLVNELKSAGAGPEDVVKLNESSTSNFPNSSSMDGPSESGRSQPIARRPTKTAPPIILVFLIVLQISR